MNSEPLWYFLRERQAIYERRMAGEPKPWTQDPILRDYRFTNVDRELDTVTQWIRKNIRQLYMRDPALWFNLAIARFINWPDTLKELGYFHRWEPARFTEVMAARQANGQKCYTGAYMVRGDVQGGLATKHEYLAHKVFTPLWAAREDVAMVLGRNSLEEAQTYLVKFFGMGGFMVDQILTDLKYTPVLRHATDWNSFCFAGPGAMRGLNRLAGRPLKSTVSQQQALEEIQVLYAEGLSLGMHNVVPNYEIHMIENILCECDKHLRVKNGEGRPRSRYPGSAD